tara:strand:- start:1088 stop:1828 length:741 start_codon:yes stop_codon:yes gene_type:complete
MFYRLKIFIKLFIFFISRFTYDIKIWKSILAYYRSYISKKNFIDTISIDKIIDWKKISLTIKKLNLSSGNVSRLEMLIITAFASTLNDGENFLEVGTFNGNTTINCALNMKKNSKIITIDLPEDAEIENIDRKDEYLEYDKKLIKDFKRKDKDFKNFNNINQIYADSTKLNFGLYDFSIAFIDGGHDYETVKSDTENCISFIKKPGVILWHDYDVTNPVGKYLHSISKKYDIKWIENTRLCILKFR